MNHRLKVEPLTQSRFAPFGTVIELDGAASFLINGGTTRRYHALAELDVFHADGQAILSIFRTNAQSSSIEINMLERHPLGSQAFYPLGDYEWLVVVADGESPNPQDCRCFRVGPRQGVQYARGVWHHPLISLTDESDFLVADRAGPGINLEEINFGSEVALIYIDRE